MSRRVPLGLFLPAAAGLAFLLLPLVGLIIGVPWEDLSRHLANPAVVTALGLSLRTATMATVICLFLGVPLAWCVARVDFPFRHLVRTLITVPLVLPPVVGGVALLLVFGRRGLVGTWLDTTFGVTLPFTTMGVVVAEAFVAMPFLVVSVESSVRAVDRRFEEASATLGATQWSTFIHVTLPMVAPGIAAGAVLCWARALGEFGATMTFAGNYPGRTQTMPLAVYLAMETDPSAALALSLVLLAISVAILTSLRGRWMNGGLGSC